MGITIHYRGSLADLSRVEDFEDRVIDLALALGADCRVWRSASEHDASRIVRGLILDLAPGQESTSLLISPEGWLVSLFDIEAAEKGELTEKILVLRQNTIRAGGRARRHHRIVYGPQKRIYARLRNQRRRGVLGTSRRGPIATEDGISQSSHEEF
jgi:hypothetical protein